MDDNELRGNRFLDAFGGVIELIDGQVPGLSLPSERLSALLSVLHREAEIVVAGGTISAPPTRGAGLRVVADD